MSDELQTSKGTQIVPVEISNEMRNSFINYSMSVIVSRALPDVRDGLKPVHRRILITMSENGLTPDKAFRKSADTVGSTLARYHPHGDASVYDAMVRLAQDFSLRYPLVEGHGNFGSIDGDPPAAYRYTEARMSKICLRMLTDIDKDTVDFGPNFDDSRKEPTVLPSRFPNLLVNGSSGIAVGMATNIPPHNLSEVIDAIDLLMANPDVSDEEIMNVIKGPDFPTSGLIMGKAGIRAAYTTGRGKITMRARTEIEEQKNGRFHIIVSELPYQVNKSRLIESIANLVKDKRIEMISDLRDESDRDGMRIVIELKREANPQVVLNQLYTYTQMQDTFGVIMLALVNGVPRVLNLRQMLTEYIKFQEQVIIRRINFDLAKAKERAHILEGLKIAIDFIDEVIAILRASKSVQEGKIALMDRFGLDDAQAQAIVQMRLGQLTGLEREKIEEELEAIRLKIEEYLAILADENKVYGVIRDELGEIKEKFGDPRRTEIVPVTGEVDIEDLIPKEDCAVTLTHFGYIKRLPVAEFKTQHRGGRGVSGMTRREEDFVENLFIAQTHDYVLFFTNLGRVYKIKTFEIPEGSRTSKGMNIVNLLQLQPEEKISAMIKISEFDDDSYLVMVTKMGLIKRIELKEFEHIRKTGVTAIGLNDNDSLAWVHHTRGQEELLVATRYGMSIRFSEDDVRCMGRTARGVKAITLDDGDEVVGMDIISDDVYVLTLTEKGKGRRTLGSEYRLQHRGGHGVTNYKAERKNDNVTGVIVVDESDDMLVIADNGIILRFAVSDISVQSRYGGGVKTMRIDEDSKLVSVAKAPKEDKDEEADDGDQDEISEKSSENEE